VSGGWPAKRKEAFSEGGKSPKKGQQEKKRSSEASESISWLFPGRSEGGGQGKKATIL